MAKKKAKKGGKKKKKKKRSSKKAAKKKAAGKKKSAKKKKKASKAARTKAKPAAPMVISRVAAPSIAATPSARTALNPAAAWPFPTGSRP